MAARDDGRQLHRHLEARAGRERPRLLAPAAAVFAHAAARAEPGALRGGAPAGVRTLSRFTPTSSWRENARADAAAGNAQENSSACSPGYSGPQNATSRPSSARLPLRLPACPSKPLAPGKRALEQRRAPAPLGFGHVDHARRGVAQAVRFADDQAPAAALELPDGRVDAQAVGVGGRVGDRQRDALLALAGLEAHAHAEGDVTRTHATQIDGGGSFEMFAKAKRPCASEAPWRRPGGPESGSA